MLSSIISYLTTQFPPNRVVALLTPLFAAASGWLATVFAQWGFALTSDQFLAAFTVGAAAAVAAAYKWLHGWQAHEARSANTRSSR